MEIFPIQSSGGFISAAAITATQRTHILVGGEKKKNLEVKLLNNLEKPQSSVPVSHYLCN